VALGTMLEYKMSLNKTLLGENTLAYVALTSVAKKTVVFTTLYFHTIFQMEPTSLGVCSLPALTA
jgi:hypothetical protein